jgi:hypothetical protein
MGEAHMSDIPTQANQGTDAPALVSSQAAARPLSPVVHETVPHSSEGKKQTAADGMSAAPSEYHSKFAEEIHNYLREYIRNADQKATFFFAAVTALLAFLNTRGGPSHWLKDVRTWTMVDGLSFVAMLFLAMSACVLLSVVFPRLKGSRRGIIFFSAIAEYDSGQEYAGTVLRQATSDIVAAKLQHTFDLSKVCVAKYRALRIGFWLGSIGVVTTLLYLLLAA